MHGASTMKFVALVTFENDGDLLQILPPQCHGACGWMAAEASSEDQARETIHSELAQIGLRLVKVDRLTEIKSVEEAAEYDSHLATNMQEWQPGKATVWGTIHTYIGGGEA
jgi:hypothetical protein